MANPFAQYVDQPADNPFAQYVQQQTQPPVSTLTDMAKGAASGLAKGVGSIAGFPGDVLNLANAGAKKIASMLPQPSQDLQTRAIQAKILDPQESTGPGNAPGSADISQAVAKPFGGLYQPQTVPGQYAQTLSEFAPTALTGGGGVLAHAARAVVPAVTSETAGQLTKGTKLEPWARLLGAVAGGLGTSAVQSFGDRPTIPPAPSVDDLKAAARQAYKAADDSGVIVSKQSFGNFANQLKDNLAEFGIDKDLHPDALAVLNKITGQAGSEADGITLKGLEILRRNASDAANATKEGDAFLGGKIKSALDQYINKLTPNDVIAGNPQTAVQSLQNARQAWHLASQGDTIAELMRRASIRAGQFSGSGYENALRTEFRRLAMNSDELGMLDKPLQDAVTKVATGGSLENWTRYAGKLAPTGTVSQLGAVGMTAANPALGVLPAIGTVARGLATHMTTRNAGIASELSRLTPAQQQLFLQSQAGSFFPRAANNVALPLLFANPLNQQVPQ